MSNITNLAGKPNYGIDAPGLVRGFLVGGLVLLTLSGIGFAIAAQGRWITWLAQILLLPAGYALGMFGLMLRESLVSKVIGREAILDQVPWTGGETVLDVGCGRGLMLVGAARRLTTGRAVGVDIWLERDQSANTESAPLENARLEGVFDRVTVQTADMRALPFADHSFDVVISSWAVHNLEAPVDRSKALSEMIRVLRHSGTIVLTDIVYRNDYDAELRRLGADTVRMVIGSAAKDWFLGLVSFGSYQPATLVAKGFRGTHLGLPCTIPPR